MATLSSEQKRRSGQAQAVGGGALALGVPAVSRTERGVMNLRLKHNARQIDRAKKAIPQRSPRGGTSTVQRNSRGSSSSLSERRISTETKYRPKSASQREGLRLQRKSGYSKLRQLESKRKLIGKPKVFPHQSKLWAASVATGVPLSYLGAKRSVANRDVHKKLDQKDVNSAYAGGTAAGIAYQGGAMLTKPVDWKNEKKIRNSPRHRATMAAHEAKYRPKGMTAGDPRFREFFRKYPKSLPGSKMKRAFTHTHTGKSGGLATLGVIGAGATGAVHGSRDHEKRKQMGTVRKAKDHRTSNSVIAGAGAVTAGTGLAAGGVPGAKAKVKPFVDLNLGQKGAKESAKALVTHPGVARAFHGGILGFRHNAHAGGIYGYKQKATENAWKGPTKDAHEAFSRGRVEGKIAPEEVVLRHLKGGKKVAGAALAGGTAATAYGITRARHKVEKSDRRTKNYNGAVLGAGAATAGVGHGGAKLLAHQDRKWSAAASRNIDEAGKLVPGIAGRVRGKPKVSDSDIRRSPETFKGVHPDVAQQAGRLRGAAVQQAHFADVYRDTGKMVGRLRNPGLVAAGIGAGGLAMTRKKSRVRKSAGTTNMSAFGVEH